MCACMYYNYMVYTVTLCISLCGLVRKVYDKTVARAWFGEGDAVMMVVFCVV